MPTRHRTLDAASKPPILVVRDRYACLSLLGQGATARVYQAWDRELHVERAIKILTVPMRGHDILRERLRSEARLMARLAHPNILQVFDVGSERGIDYVVMALAEESLQQRLEQHGPMSVEQAGSWVLQILAALSAAHAAGIVHRDVKPQNILLRDGQALLADFGIARSLDQRHTETNVALGSLAFMAPEQRVDAHRVGPQADLYAAATTLYVLITAANPIDLFAAPPDSPRWSMLPEPLAAVLQRAATYDPAARYGTAREMAEALSSVLDQEISLFDPLITLEREETRIETAFDDDTRLLPVPAPVPWAQWRALLWTLLLLFTGLSIWLPLAGRTVPERAPPLASQPAQSDTHLVWSPSPLPGVSLEETPMTAPLLPPSAVSAVYPRSAVEPLTQVPPPLLSDGKVGSPSAPPARPVPVLGPSIWEGQLGGAPVLLALARSTRRRGHVATMQSRASGHVTVRVRLDPGTQVVSIDGPRRREGQLTMSADQRWMAGRYDGQTLVLFRR